MKLNIICEIDSGDIAENLVQSDALKLIEEIDDAQQDYDFTLSVAKLCVKKLIACCDGTDETFDFNSLK